MAGFRARRILEYSALVLTISSILSLSLSRRPVIGANGWYREYLRNREIRRPDFADTISLVPSRSREVISRLFNSAATRYANAAKKKTSSGTTREFRVPSRFLPLRVRARALAVHSFSSTFAVRRSPFAPRHRVAAAVSGALSPRWRPPRSCCHTYSFHFLDRPS